MPVYVQHEVLGKVPDVFNAEALWRAPGLALFARRPLLRDLLERSPRELRGRAATRCFSHVTLMLAQDEVDDDRHLTRGARVRDLAQSLAALHQKDFGDLLGGDDVRYDVIGTEALAPGEVEVKFGHAVYLAGPGETPLYKVSASSDGVVWRPVCPVYPGQRLALIGHDAEAASCAVPGWPFGADGAILLINDGPEAPIEVQVRPKNALECVFDAANGYYCIKAKGGAAPARMLLKVARSTPLAPPASDSVPAPAAGRPPAVWKTRAADEAEQTAVPLSHRPGPGPSHAAASGAGDATYAPLAQQRVSLVALALPRLSRYRDTGALALEIGFDGALALAAPGQAAISFAVDAGDRLHAITSAGREALSAPATLTPLGGGTVELLAAPRAMDDRYCALLRLPTPVAAPVAPGARFVFGRSAPMLAALRVLDSPRFLRHADGAEAASADRIGLSRSAFSFELSAEGFRIGRLSPTQALYHLDEQFNFVAMVSEAYALPAGHHLVAGHYVLRFDA